MIKKKEDSKKNNKKTLILIIAIIIIIASIYYFNTNQVLYHKLPPYEKKSVDKSNEELEENHLDLIIENLPFRDEVFEYWENFRGPGDCKANNCDDYCSIEDNLVECVEWCEGNSDLCPDSILEEWTFRFNQYNKDNLIFLPVDVYIIKYDSDSLSSIRDEENLRYLFSDVNKIWGQANISVKIIGISALNLEDESLYLSIEKLHSYLINSENYDTSRINAYFVQTLHGSNGIALPGNVFMVADRTSVYDFRASSHEIGHILGLQHVGPINRLLARGVNGFELTDEEIRVARDNSLRLFY